MELSIKLELTDDQFEKFQSSVQESIDLIIKDESFKDTVKDLLMQSVSDFVNSDEGKKLAKNSVTNASFSFDNCYYRDFSKYMVAVTSEEFIESCKKPFMEIYKSIISDKTAMTDLIHSVFITAMANSLTAACEEKISDNRTALDMINAKVERVMCDLHMM